MSTTTFSENSERTRFTITRPDGEGLSGEVVQLTREHGWMHHRYWSGERAMTVDTPEPIAADAAANLVASWKTEARPNWKTEDN